MTDDNTTPEAVERLAKKLEACHLEYDEGHPVGMGEPVYGMEGVYAADTLRALSARLAEAERERDEALARVAAAYEDAAHTCREFAVLCKGDEATGYAYEAFMEFVGVFEERATDAERDALAEVRRAKADAMLYAASIYRNELGKASACQNSGPVFEAALRAEITVREEAAAIRNMKDETDE